MSKHHYDSSSIPRIRNLMLRGRKWRIRWVTGLRGADGKALLGLCEHKDAVISLEVGQLPNVMLDTILHEILHAEFPMATERNVSLAAGEILRALERVGFRLCLKGV